MKYHYYPDYLVKSKNPKDKGIEYITNVIKVLLGMGIPCRSTKLIIDGGNMVPCGPNILDDGENYSMLFDIRAHCFYHIIDHYNGIYIANSLYASKTKRAFLF